MPRSGSSRPTGRGRRTTTGDLSRIGTTERRLARRTGAPYLVPGALAAAAAIAVWATWGHLASCGASIDAPETQVRKALAEQTRAHLADVYGFRGGGTVELFSVRFSDVTSEVDGARATVVALLAADGRAVWRDQEAKLAYIGREQFHMKPCSIALWCGEGDQFQRLRGVLLALFRRHDAWQQRDPEAYGRLLAADYRDGPEDRAAALRRIARTLAARPGPARILAWQVRVERGTAEVGEDLEIEGGADGGAPRRERHVYRLAHDGDRWVFAGGV